MAATTLTLRVIQPFLLTDTTNAGLLDRLAQEDKVSALMLARARQVAEESSEDLASVLLSTGVVAEQDLARLLAELAESPLLRDLPPVPEHPLAGTLSPRFLLDNLVLPLSIEDGHLEVAMAFPHRRDVREALEMAAEHPLNVRTGVASEIKAALEALLGVLPSSSASVSETAATGAGAEGLEQLRDLASEAPVVRYVSHLFITAMGCDASDIHVEPLEAGFRVRYRVDGVLIEAPATTSLPGVAVCSRIKLLAGMDIAERRLPQDGRIVTRVQGKDVEMRVSSVPSVYGESIVLRLLRHDAVRPELGALGFSADLQQALRGCIERPHGITLVTGPTGSGKTTTLYALLGMLNATERKIISVEDPVEYELPGVNQIQVKPAIGLTFANALRAIVRQDPDVIMVGEIRDAETAQIATQSALTGHLVLSTLHTNSVGSSITRLLDMGMEPYLVASTVNGLMAQRLVRLLCRHCAHEAEPDTDAVGDMLVPVGCPQCAGTGFRGRTVIAEFAELTSALRPLVLSRADGVQIQNAARQAGMRTMAEGGERKAREGLTTMREVWRATRDVDA